MKISSIDINGFGVWHDRRWEGLAPGVNVFHGPNEAGKTTLMSFIRSVLFGFERRSHPRRYEPLSGGDYGGWLEVTGVDIANFDNGPVRIERSGGRHVRGRVAVRPSQPVASGGGAGASGAGQGTDDPERLLEKMLGGTTRTLYHNVFAFGLEELEHFRTLEESEVAAHISGAGMGVGARRWSRVWKDLEARRGSLFLPRGQNTTLNRAFRELESVRKELDETGEEPEDYFRVLESLGQLEVEIGELEESVRLLDVRIAHYRKVRVAEPHRARRQALEREIQSIEHVDRFPEGGVDRLNLLFDRRRSLESKLDKSRQEIMRIRGERQALTRKYAPQDLMRLRHELDELRGMLPRRDASGEAVAGATSRRDSILREKEQHEARQARVAPPSLTSMLVLALLIEGGALGVAYSGYPAAGWGGPALLVLFAVWYYTRIRAVGRWDQAIAASVERMAHAEDDLDLALTNDRQIAASIERLAGRSDYSDSDLRNLGVRVRELEDCAERLRSLEAKLEAEDRQGELVRRDLEETDRHIQSLFEEGGATSESEFFRRSDLFRRRRELEADLASTPSGVVEPLEDSSAVLTESEYPDAVARYDAWIVRLREARTEAGRLEERLATLSRSEQRSRARLRQESVMAQIDEASERWAVLTLCRTLLTDTRQIYETERQPEVLRHASRFFERMTGGNWVRVISPLDSGILVESPQGDRVSPENLSRGTAEQLYLAMRLALVREYSRHVQPLPVVLDDIFVNFDPERTRRSIEAVRDLSATHQILLFTCHPHLVQMVEEIVPRAELYPLQ